MRLAMAMWHDQQWTLLAMALVMRCNHTADRTAVVVAADVSAVSAVVAAADRCADVSAVVAAAADTSATVP